MHSKTIVVLIVTVFGICSCDQTNVGCDPSWYATDTQCYYIETSKSVTRDQASIDCGNKQANLFRFSDPQELAYIQKTISGFNGDGFWTDLTDLRFDGTLTGTGLWMWGQYLQLDNSTIPWEVYPTANPSESCGAINIQGKFVNLQCTQRLGFICQIDNTTGIKNKTGNTGCPPFWSLTDPNACFYFSDTTNGTQLLTYQQAQQKCAAMPVPVGINKPAHLLTVKDASIQKFIDGQRKTLTKSTTMYWTGLKRQANSWSWANGDPFNPQYITWAKEPDHIAGNEHCGTIRTDGKFTDQDCKKNFNYICQKGTEIDDSKYYFGCGGWARAGHKCYMFYDGPKTTWQDAQSRCKSMNANLIKIETTDEKRWLEWQMTMVDVHPSLYWSGLNDQDTEGVYKWADKTVADSSLIRWNSEPNDWFGNEDCAAILIDGVYNDMDCTAQTGFICEYLNIIHQAGQPICLPGWINNPNTYDCYYFSATNASYTWSEANDYCHKTKIISTQIPTTLLSVNGVGEKTFIQAQMAKLGAPGKGYWTALNDQFAEGQWNFYDSFNNPPNPQVITWAGEPSDDGTKNQDCTFLLYGGRYFDANCKGKHGFICERYADGLAAVYGGTGSVLKTDFFKIAVLAVATLLVKNNI